MSGAIYTDISITGKVQGDGVQMVTLTESQKLATKHQVTAVKGTATVGTVAVAVKPFGRNTFEPLLDQYGVAVVIDIAAQKTFVFEGRIDSWQFTPTSFDGTYGMALAGWQ